MDDDFTGRLNPDHWSCEAQVVTGLRNWKRPLTDLQTGGFEHGEFSWATADKHNGFIDNEGLRLVPTLTTELTDIDEVQWLDGYTINLTSAFSD